MSSGFFGWFALFLKFHFNYGCVLCEVGAFVEMHCSDEGRKAHVFRTSSFLFENQLQDLIARSGFVVVETTSPFRLPSAM
ncbi:hypothetical protein KC19_10G160500 [Ceratodon purpureus]|uniref:Secreted protein n=1 Tax=Ceratodon purpureus TaxID=3225 RepID=A0A8T0GKV9_CERPU|nr:hypothetical protein KC19_10G160500 [Ceratodon purpureus]